MSFKYWLFYLTKSGVTGAIILFKITGFALDFLWFRTRQIFPFYSSSNTQGDVENCLNFLQIEIGKEEVEFKNIFWPFIFQIPL